MSAFDVLHHHREESKPRHTPDLQKFYLYKTKNEDVFEIVDYHSQRHFIVIEHKATKERFVKFANEGSRVFDSKLQDALCNWELKTPIGLEFTTEVSSFNINARYPEFRKGLSMS